MGCWKVSAVPMVVGPRMKFATFPFDIVIAFVRVVSPVASKIEPLFIVIGLIEEMFV